MGLHEQLRVYGAHPDTTGNAATLPAFIRGQAGADGIALGRAAVIDASETLSLGDMAEAGTAGKADDFERCVHDTAAQLEALQERLEGELSDTGAGLIFSAHLLILKDACFTGQMRTRISEGVAPAVAIAETVDQYVKLFSNSPLAHLREKVLGVRDLGHRLMRNLFGEAEGHGDYDGQIVIAAELLPSDVVKLSAQNPAGLVLRAGSVAAHIAILARSLDIPLVVSGDDALRLVPTGTTMIIDGGQGLVFISPDDEVQSRYAELAADRAKLARAEGRATPETWTADGQRVALLANINLLHEADLADQLNAEGIGLYRSEFPFIIRSEFPSEDEQCRIYAALLDKMAGRPVTFFCIQQPRSPRQILE